MIGALGEDRPARLRLRRRRRNAARAISLHQRAPVRLLVVGHADHEHLHVDPEQRAGEGERAAPLAGAGLRHQLLHALPAGCRTPARRRCWACGCPRATRPRTCSRSAPASAAPSPAAGRGTAAWAAIGDRRRARGPGSRSRARWSPPAGSAPSGTAARDRRGRPASACPDAAPAAAVSAGRPGGCTRPSESSTPRGRT